AEAVGARQDANPRTRGTPIAGDPQTTGTSAARSPDRRIDRALLERGIAVADREVDLPSRRRPQPARRLRDQRLLPDEEDRARRIGVQLVHGPDGPSGPLAHDPLQAAPVGERAAGGGQPRRLVHREEAVAIEQDAARDVEHAAGIGRTGSLVKRATAILSLD